MGAGMKNGYSEKIIKSFKEIRMTNCGVDALSQICELKNISAFSLVHMGRDNGIELSVFKVNDINDLPRVHRPAIFHQKDHFVHVRNGEIMPEGEYTGYVIGPIVTGRVISLAESKSIRGGKNFITGKNKDGEKVGGGALGTILAVVGGLVLPGIGAAVGLGTGALGGVGSAIGGAIGGATGSAITHDNVALGALSGAALGYGAGAIASGIGGAASGVGSSALNSTATQGAFNAARGAALNPATTAFSLAPGGAAGAAGLAGGVSAFNAANAASSAGNTLAAFGGGTAAPRSAISAANAITPNSSFSLSSVPFGQEAAQQFGLKTIGQGVQNGVNKIGSDISSANSVLSKATGGAIGGANGLNIGNAATLAGAAGVFGSHPPAYSGATPQDNYSAVSQFLGKNALSDASKSQNLDYVNTSIQDLQKQFTGNNQRMLDSINTAYDNQKQQLVHQYAQAGQNLANSSELQDKVGQLEQKRVNDVTLANQELSNQALGQAIQVKQQALSQGMAAGQWDQSLAFQLAQLTGDQQNLQYAIANNDYESFQQIMGKLMTMGLPQQATL